MLVALFLSFDCERQAECPTQIAHGLSSSEADRTLSRNHGTQSSTLLPLRQYVIGILLFSRRLAKLSNPDWQEPSQPQLSVVGE